MKGNRIVLTPDRGFHVEGVINAAETPYPGTVYQLDPTQTLQGGRNVWKAWTGATGAAPLGPYIILKEDLLQGKSANQAYAAGDRAFGFIPLPGAELNVCLKDITGTAPNITAGDMLIVVTATGRFEETTGSPITQACMAMETLADPTSDTLIWVTWK